MVRRHVPVFLADCSWLLTVAGTRVLVGQPLSLCFPAADFSDAVSGMYWALNPCQCSVADYCLWHFKCNTHCALTACHSTLLNFTCMRCFALLLLTQCNLYCLHFTYIVMLLHFITFYWISLHTANHWLWHMQPQERQMFSSGFSNSLSIIFNLILKIFN